MFETFNPKRAAPSLFSPVRPALLSSPMGRLSVQPRVPCSEPARSRWKNRHRRSLARLHRADAPHTSPAFAIVFFLSPAPW